MRTSTSHKVHDDSRQAARAHMPGSTQATPSLLLRAMNPDADAALRVLLSARGLRYADSAGCIVLSTEDMTAVALSQALEAALPKVLQRNIRGAYVGSPLIEANAAAEMRRAEPLAALIEQAEFEWARDALRNGWVHSVFQPIVSAESGRVYAYEALVRAFDPARQDLIGARQLIYACQRLNIEHEMDRQARASAVRSGARWIPDDALLFINVHHDAIYEPSVSLGDTVEEARQSRVPMSRLVFELADVDLCEQHAHLAAILAYMRGTGSAIALDNVGGGRSSLETIADLRPDYVKLDRELVADAPVVPSARHTLVAVVELARRLQMRVVGQGIETPEQLRACRDAGVDLLQGYLFAQPSEHPELYPAGASALSFCTR